MKKRISIALAAILLAGAFGVPSFAQTTGSVSGKHVSIVLLSEASKGSGGTGQVPTITPKATSDAQAMIHSDAELRSFLQQHNVELHNVIAIETAANGGRIVYLK
ncbi:Hypothetical protein NGAL_HAMBI2605_65610 [Neorhizobium galegae bv. orientalis]|nr:Hypothetical protein NGAL_HAMBI2605_65610 [Neorhizobium galegae bv. orientalis]